MGGAFLHSWLEKQFSTFIQVGSADWSKQKLCPIWLVQRAFTLWQLGKASTDHRQPWVQGEVGIENGRMDGFVQSSSMCFSLMNDEWMGGRMWNVLVRPTYLWCMSSACSFHPFHFLISRRHTPANHIHGGEPEVLHRACQVESASPNTPVCQTCPTFSAGACIIFWREWELVSEWPSTTRQPWDACGRFAWWEKLSSEDSRRLRYITKEKRKKKRSANCISVPRQTAEINTVGLQLQ